MSYRLTFFRIEKKKLDDVADWTDEKFKYDEDDVNYEHSGYEELRESATELMFDLTNWLYFDEFVEMGRNGEEDKVWSRIFNNELDIECDLAFMKMDKEQFKALIDLVRHHITDVYDRQYIELYKNEELNDLYVGKIKGDELEKKYSCAYGIRKEKNFNLLDKLVESTKDVNHRRGVWNIYYRNDEHFWEIVEGYGRTKVSFTDDWESCLCNLLYLYRTMDWENDRIMIIGG